MKRKVSVGKSLVAPSNSRVMRMHLVCSASPGARASVGQDSTQMPQYMHLPMSMSKRVMPRTSSFFSMSMAMTLIGQSRSHALQAVQISMATSRQLYAMVPTKQTNDTGMKYFQHRFII